MKKILVSIISLFSLGTNVVAYNVCKSSKIIITPNEEKCILEDGLYHCDVDVYDINNNTVQTYHDVAILITDCHVEEIYHEDLQNSMMIATRAVTEDLDAQSEIEDEFIYNYFNIRAFQEYETE